MRPEVIVWLGIVASTFLYALVVYVVVAPRVHGSFEESLRSQYAIIPYVLALAAFIGGTLMSALMRDRPERVRMIITLAIYEMAAIFGLIAALLVGDWRLYIAPWVVALLGFWRVFPARDAR